MDPIDSGPDPKIGSSVTVLRNSWLAASSQTPWKNRWLPDSAVEVIGTATLSGTPGVAGAENSATAFWISTALPMPGIAIGALVRSSETCTPQNTDCGAGTVDTCTVTPGTARGETSTSSITSQRNSWIRSVNWWRPDQITRTVGVAPIVKLWICGRSISCQAGRR